MLGSGVLNVSTLPAYADTLAEIGRYLSADADILLYGCDVGAGSAGTVLLDQLAAITGANIAASTDITGAAAMGGNWLLDASAGFVNTTALQVPAYSGILALSIAPLVNEFQVNTTTLSDQYYPSITGLTDGGYVVSWMSLNQDGSGWGIYAQRYNASGAAMGGEVQVNTTTASSQEQPSITGLTDGGYVVSWMSSFQDGSGYGIYAQHYNASGVAVGGEVQVNTTTLSDQYSPSITGLTDGGYVVSWMSYGQDGSGWGIYAQHYNASGVAVGGEVQVNTTTLNEQYSPSITGLTDGGYVVSWTSYGQDGSGGGIYAQHYNASGVAVGAEVQVNTNTLDSQESPSITGLTDGGYVVSWMSYNQDGSGFGIYAQRYNASGVAVGAEVQVNTTSLSNQQQPSITGLTDGGYVVSWMSLFQDGSTWGIYAQHYNASGVAVGGEVQVNTTTLYEQLIPSITGLTDGGYVVSWLSVQDGSGYDIYAQHYNASGVAVGGEVQVNSTTLSDQFDPSITWLTDGGYVVSWMSFGQDGSGYGIYTKRYDAGGTALDFKLQGDVGNNTLTWTGSGNVILAGDSGNDVLQGGNGNDTLSDVDSTGLVATNSLAAGAGNDIIHVLQSHASSVTSVSGGSGRDSYLLQANSIGQLLVSDFTGGATGDILNINTLLTSSSGYSGGNPFDAALGYLRLLQQGADTLLQWDQDGAATATNNWQTVITLQNTSAATLTAENFAPATGITSIEIVQTNTAPVLSVALVDQMADEDAAFNFVVPASTFSDPDTGDTQSYSASLANGAALPAWLSFNATTRSLSGTPSQADVATFDVRVTVTDAGGLMASDVFALTINNVNDTPTGSATATLIAGTEDTAYTINTSDLLQGFTDVDGDTLSVSGLTADHGTLTNNNNGSFTFSPDANYNGSVSLAYNVIDGNGGSVAASQAFSLAAVNDAPTLTGLNGSIPPHAPILLTFDEFSRGSTITTQYQSQGVTVSGATTFVGIFTPFPTNSGANLAVAPSGVMTFTLDPAITGPIRTVSARFSGDVGSGLYAYDAAGGLIGQALLAAGQPYNTLLSVTTSDTPIASVAFIGGGGSYGVDDLTFQPFSSATPYIENGSAVVLEGNALLSDVELNAANYSGATLSLMRDGGANSQDLFSVRTGSSLAALTAGTDLVVAGTHIGSVSQNSNGSLLLSFNSNATQSLVNSAVQQIAYQNSADAPPSSVLINWSFNDGSGQSNAVVTGQSTVSITAVNDAPTGSATATLLAGTEDTVYTINASDLLQGFTDVDGDTLSVSALTADHGTLTNHNNGTYTFNPVANYNGSVSLAYNVIDGNGGSVAGSQTVSLAAVNDAPTGSATATLIAGTEDTAYTINVSDLLQGFTDVDGDVLSVSGLTADHGTLTDNNNGTYTFNPVANYNGSVSLAYNVIDGNGGSVAGSQAFILAAVNDAPVAVGNTLAAIEDTTVIYTAASLLNNDTDIENDTLSLAAVISGAGGTAVLNANGSVSFTPDANFNGAASFSYITSDGSASSNSANVTVNVAPVNDAPILNSPLADRAFTRASAFVFAMPTGSFTDVDGDNLTYTAILADGNALPSWLQFSAATATFSGNPAIPDVGNLNVRVTASDPTGLSINDVFVLSIITAPTDLVGTANADTLTGTIGNDIIYGLAGNDQLNGGAGSDQLVGGAGNDLLNGGAGNDTMYGGLGDDTYVVNATGDLVVENAGGGRDTVQSSISYILGANLEDLILTGTANNNGTGNALNNVLTGNGGNNTLEGDAGNDQLFGQTGNDTLNGGSGRDTLVGGLGDDILNGGTGRDTLIGGVGNDIYVIDDTGDTATELSAQGIDTVQSNLGTYTLTANIENLVLIGAATTGAGNGLNNVITGNSLNNVLRGGAGNDQLLGLGENDTLTGGTGNDQFVFSTTPSADNIDRVTDFTAGQDQLVLDALVFTGLNLHNQALDAAMFRSGAGITTAADADDHVIFNTSNGALYYDADGAGGAAAVQFATIVGVSTLDPASIWIMN